MLGSPLGISLAHFLLQHKAELGIKYVTLATIFRDNLVDDSPQVYLAFKIEDVPEPDEDIEMQGSHVEARNNGRNVLRVHELAKRGEPGLYVHGVL
jgi:hypothetical protein